MNKKELKNLIESTEKAIEKYIDELSHTRDVEIMTTLDNALISLDAALSALGD